MRRHFPLMLMCYLPMASSSQSWAQEPRLRDTLTGHADSVMSVAYSPDGETLASGARDGTIKLWDVKAGKERATMGDREPEGDRGVPFSVAYSRDGQTLAAASYEDIKLWDVKTGERRATLKGHTK